MKLSWLIKYLCMAPILVCMTHAFGQAGNDRERDSLLNCLNTAKHDSVKVDALNGLFLHYEYADVEKGRNYLKQAIDLAGKIGYVNGEGEAYTNLGYSNEDAGNNKEALKNYYHALKLYQKSGNKKGQANAYNNIGFSYASMHENNKAIKYMSLSLKMKKEINDEQGVAAAYNNLGLVYSQQGNYPEALKSYFSCLSIGEKIKNKQVVSSVYANIGTIYYDQGNLDDAYVNFTSALKEKLELEDLPGIASCYISLGLIHQKRNENRKALDYYEKALKLEQKIQYKKGEGTVLTNMGILYGRKKNYAKALECHEAALAIGNEIEDWEITATAYKDLGSVNFKLKKFKEAKALYKKANEQAHQIGYKPLIRDAVYGLALIDSAMGNFDEAFKNQQLYYLYNDSLDNEETRKKTMEAQMTYDFEKREAIAKATRKQVIRNQKTLQVEQNHKQNIFIWFTGMGFALALVLAFFVYVAFRTKQKTNALLSAKNELIELQKREVEEKNLEITQSIAYAERIQHAILPNHERLKAALPHSFVFFKPRDIVSGDFYWFSEKKEKIIFAVADCTGHGVPGAFMSMIGNTLLNEVVNEKHITNPAEILNQLNKGVIDVLRSDSSKQYDGMDISVCCFDKKNLCFEFAAANHTAYLISNNTVTEIEGDFLSIGGMFSKTGTSFTNSVYKLHPGSAVYLFTDGYADQFGGEHGGKFMASRLKALLLEISNKSMEEQSKLIEKTFVNWKGKNRQLDDVLLAGIRF